LVSGRRSPKGATSSSRADVLLDTALSEHQRWATALGEAPKQARATAAWRKAARTVAAYRDRYGVAEAAPLGTPAENDTQGVDAVRARAALDRARALASTERREDERLRRTGADRVGSTL